MGKETELWKDVKGFEGIYFISSMGRLKKIKPAGVVYPKLFRTYDGYLTCKLYTSHKVQYCIINRLVGLAFVKNPLGKPTTNHKNGNKLDNRAVNLEWVSDRENLIHYYINKKLIGAIYHKKMQRWYSKININRCSIFLGHYNSKHEAHLAYLFANVLYGIQNKYL